MSYSQPLYFAVFLPLVALCYQLLPQRHRWKVLLAASYIFFYATSRQLILYLLFSTVSVHHLGLWLGTIHTERSAAVKAADRAERKTIKAEYQKQLRRVVVLGILLHLGILLVVKYSMFFAENLNALFHITHLPFTLPEHRFALPLGISFYTMQAVSYLVDVYRGTVQPDRNLPRLALWMAFFPQIMEGPICRYSDTADQLWACQSINYHNLTFGCQRFAWGMMKKIVVADQLNWPVKEIFKNYGDYNGAVIFFGMIAYTVQLYMDFSGSLDMVIGAGEIFGVKLPENFRQPFFSKTVSEFWTRWHITLGTWFKDYIFYPVSLSGGMKTLTSNARKKLGNHYGPMLASGVALLAVWSANGLWHGSAWNYICFGLYHFVLIFSGTLFEPTFKAICDKLHINRQSKPWHAWQIVRTVALVNIGELIFRAHGMAAALRMLKKMFTDFDPGVFARGEYLVEVSGKSLIVCLVTVLIVLGHSILRERGLSLREIVAAKPLPVRWLCYYLLILFIVMFGAYAGEYAPIDPIYAGF